LKKYLNERFVAGTSADDMFIAIGLLVGGLEAAEPPAVIRAGLSLDIEWYGLAYSLLFDNPRAGADL